MMIERRGGDKFQKIRTDVRVQRPKALNVSSRGSSELASATPGEWSLFQFDPEWVVVTLNAALRAAFQAAKTNTKDLISR